MRTTPLASTDARHLIAHMLHEIMSRSVAYPRGIKGIIPPKLPKLELIADAKYVANLVNVNVVVNAQQCSLLHGHAVYLHNDIFTSAKEVICFRHCLSVCLSVCLLATLRKNFRTDLHVIFREGWQWPNKQTTQFWWRSQIRIRIETLARRALVEVCTVPVLLVLTDMTG